MVRLGAGLDSESRLSSAAMQRGWDCLARFAERLRGFAPQQVRAVATQTFREARNRAEFLLPAHRVLGQAGCLDVARFRAFLSMELGCSVEDIQALLLGGHGDDMVPLPRFTSVHGIPIDQLLPKETIDKCVQRAKVGGGEIVQLMGTSAYYAPASGVIQMAEAIIKDKKRILPCAAYCEDAFGVAPGAKGAGYFVGVPCVLGKGGMERIVEIKMNADEQKLFNESAQHVKDLVKVVKDLAAKPNEAGQPSFPKLV
jgi:malate dehydrogenase